MVKLKKIKKSSSSERESYISGESLLLESTKPIIISSLKLRTTSTEKHLEYLCWIDSSMAESTSSALLVVRIDSLIKHLFFFGIWQDCICFTNVSKFGISQFLFGKFNIINNTFCSSVSLFLSGCHYRANFLYAFLIYYSVALRSNSNIL